MNPRGVGGVLLLRSEGLIGRGRAVALTAGNDRILLGPIRRHGEHAKGLI